MNHRLELLTVDQMAAADRLTIAAGTPGIDLMENAGAAIAQAIRENWQARPTLVLCGPGNNGGDGWVVARLLAEAGWPARLAAQVPAARLKGDAALAAGRWPGPVEALDEGTDPDALLADGPLVVDALFGAGLVRPVEGVAAALLAAVRNRGSDLVAVDMPSGVHGDSGEVWGVAAPAALTVTFFRKKPGHVLLPGRQLCGRVIVADIGIPDAVLSEIRPATAENGPGIWRETLPRPDLGGHKYTRGHAVVLGGERMTGAARLAAQAARRAGAGLVTIAAPDAAFAIYAAGPPGLLVASLGEWRAMMADPRRNAVLAGPGTGVGEKTRRAVREALAAGKATVLDADAITSFAEYRTTLLKALHERCVLTPHEGEFARLFDLAGPKPARAAAAAAEAGAVVLLKGADTVIAAPDGRLAINTNAPADLATAGSGDVLAGLILGLLAQGMPPFEAAAAGAWMHGDAASRFGRGLIAEDLVDGLPAVWRGLADGGG
ncbi:MAG: NAD(P)H-hydrate dehydratase [Inquilinus sp.]|nr:NAD(P)H-hydrate dehydratase [Inquilinus sp.]